MDHDSSNIILFPDYITLKEEVEKLRIEISMLMLERDGLLFTTLKNIEAEYMTRVGYLENKAFERQCLYLRLKRKLEMIQASLNRQETVNLKQIDAILNTEFKAYQEQIAMQIERLNAAIKRKEGEFLNQEESRKLKKLYRTVVKALHPDLNPDLSPELKALFLNAVQAFENGDLKTLEIIEASLIEPALPEESGNALIVLKEEKERLSEVIAKIKEKIDTIKKTHPYTLKAILDDEEELSARIERTQNMIDEFNRAIDMMEDRIEKALGRL